MCDFNVVQLPLLWDLWGHSYSSECEIYRRAVWALGKCASDDGFMGLSHLA